MGKQLSKQQLQQLTDEFCRKVKKATVQEVANILWAVADMEQQVPTEHLQLLDAAIARHLHTATSQAVSNSFWACAQLSFMPCQLLLSLEQRPEQLQRLLHAAKPQDLSNMAVACAWLGCTRPDLFDAVLQQAVALLQQAHRTQSTDQHLCNLVWATAVLDKQQQADKVLLLAGACSSLWDSVHADGLCQVYQLHLWLQDHRLPAGDSKGLRSVLTQQHLEQCRSRREQQMEVDASKVSALQQSVFDVVLRLLQGHWQQPPVMEQPTPDKAAVVDIVAVTAAGVQLAVEVDVPKHFISPGNQLNGPTQHRNRALAARGYTVVSIPYWEWDALQTSGQQLEYLQRKLAPVL